MPDSTDWIFEIIWDLSDRADAAKLPRLAEKLEEAMDTYLSEALGREVGSKQGQFQHETPPRGARNHHSHRRVRLSSDLRAKIAGPAPKSGMSDQFRAGRSAPAKKNRTADVTFAWPL